MARVLYLGPPSSVLPDLVTSDALLSRLGRNTGNLLFGDAVQRHLSANTLCRLDDLLRREDPPLPLEAMAPADVEARFDVIVIGASNFLHASSDFVRWARFLESVRLPTVIIGLGAQAPDYSSRVVVPEGTQRLVRIVAERCTSLGVRGEFTASVLDSLGITNVRVIGCPSMFWTCRPHLSISVRPRRGRLAVSVNGSGNVVAHASDVAAAARVEGMLARLSCDQGYPYVLQNESELMDILFDAPGACDDALVRALMERYGMSERSPASFIDFVRQRARVYASTGAWLEAVAECDLVLGTRFHGTLIGLLAGVPGIIFVHDARTRELCELLQIPHRDVRTVDAIDIDTLLDSLDFAPLMSTYPRLYRNYVEFLDENGLEHALPH